MKNIIIVSLVLFLLNGCSSKQNKNNQTGISHISRNEKLLEIDVDKARTVDRISYSSLFSNPKTIILETNKDCLIKSIDRMQVYKSKIYILDRQTQSLFAFDLNGTFLNKIGTVGGGPGEYTDVSDFIIDENENILYMLDNYSSRLYQYKAESGEYIKMTALANNNVSGGLFQYISGYIYSNAASITNEYQSDYLLQKIDVETGIQEVLYLDPEKYNQGWNYSLINTGGFFIQEILHHPNMYKCLWIPSSQYLKIK